MWLLKYAGRLSRAGPLLGNVLVWRRDPQQLAASSLGQWMLVQAEPSNLILRTLGFTVGLVGIWRRSKRWEVSGVLTIVAGRLIGNLKRQPSSAIVGRSGRPYLTCSATLGSAYEALGQPTTELFGGWLRLHYGGALVARCLRPDLTERHRKDLRPLLPRLPLVDG